ncbi:uncharacterized protein EI90DRAFT_3054578 [Cantharellus anzutake]|uniref:uncharacterized protein n=1 Tax=Cantharellus anzutake TaxID=1750568 RepID=UPI001908133F|nr:uncharacterized protein EI90DRAFT_3054578 [Cantharellus anzutake]KAF8332833.1 hypothetical protein EI90DRAFT_3054578 [Cantharellus anzutake]
MGYLLDGFPSRWDRCSADGRVIISHGGGCTAKSDPPNKMKGRPMSRDHSLDTGSVKSLWRAHKNFKAIILIVGPKCRSFPFRFRQKYKFVVLGAYAITHVWAYPDEASATSKSGAFQKEGQGLHFCVAMIQTLRVHISKPPATCFGLSG